MLIGDFVLRLYQNNKVFNNKKNNLIFIFKTLDAVPAYAIATDKELAEIAKLKKIEEKSLLTLTCTT